MKLFVVLAVCLAALALQGALFRRLWSRGLTADLSFSDTAAVEGETSRLVETVSNRKFLPLPILHVKFRMGKELPFLSGSNSRITDQNYRSDVFSCMPWQEIRRTLEFSCTKRGYYPIREMDLVSYDLFFLHHCAANVPVDTALYVYPRPADPFRLELPLRDLLGQLLARRALLSDPFEIRSVRPYETYDPLRTVNWKATARTGELQVNVYSPASSQKAAILLDIESDRIFADTDLTEESIRLCGSIAAFLIGRGIPAAIYSNGADCLTGEPSRLEAGAGSGHLHAVMELLARIQVSAGSTGSKTAVNGARIAGSLQDADTSMENLISMLCRGREKVLAPDSLYILISPGQRKSLSDAFGAAAVHSPGSVWILPMRPGEKLRIPGPGPIRIYEWEVPYGHSQMV